QTMHSPATKMASNQNNSNRHEADRPKHNTAAQKSAQHSSNKHQTKTEILRKLGSGSIASQLQKSNRHEADRPKHNTATQKIVQHSSNKHRAARPKHINQN
ncbi:unnamed protein product, partial [Ilex paraguariensis]